MPVEVLMPSLSPTMKSGKLSKWLKKEGDYIKQGEVIAEVETDKAIMEVEVIESGIIGKLLVNSGTDVNVNALIALLLSEEEDSKSLEGYSPSIVEANKIVEIDKKVFESPTIHSSNNIQNRILASPISKKLAAENNIDLSEIKGSGPGQRVIKSDVLLKIEKKNMHSDTSHKVDNYTLIPHSSMRKVIASRLTAAKQNIPHFYLSLDCGIDKLIHLRQKININQLDNKISINDLILKATGLTLVDVPELNSSWCDEGIKRYNTVDISVAVGISEGLITPIVRNVDQKTLTTISKEVKDLIEKARKGKLIPEQYQGGGFTISNLGNNGVKRFEAIINPPQSAILAIGCANKQPIVDNDNNIVISTMITLTISCDHRVIDGLVAAKWLSTLKQYIENPMNILI